MNGEELPRWDHHASTVWSDEDMGETQSNRSEVRVGSLSPRFHHVGIQTNDIDNCAAWYTQFLGCWPAWSLDRFSELTRSRLPGITMLTEMVVGDVRLHLFERPGRAADPAESAVAFQHFCFGVDEPDDLPELRRRWIELYESGRYTFASTEQPTEVVTDDDGVQSFYALDVNGLEFEFTYVPTGTA
jgi:catechol 2,3-dioxygenase-like lactoylglutathione lyase family enzyme